MITIDRILIPSDLSDASQTALAHAARFAQWYEARVSVLYVASALFVPALLGAPRDVVMRTSTTATYAKQEILKELLQSIRMAGIDPATVDVTIDDGDPAHVILRHAETLTTGLLVMGTHGRTGFDRVALGSVAEKVLRKARCPVLTVPPSSMAAAPLPVKRLLCPVDFSAPALTAFEYALSIAQESDAHLTLLHVLDWPAAETEALGNVAPGADQYRRFLEERAERQLEPLRTRAGTDFCEIASSLAYGSPYERIIEAAAAERADLIVMGVRGRNALDVTLFGSTTNQVVRRATCPVLTLRN